MTQAWNNFNWDMYDLFFQWSVTNTCNYSCQQCNSNVRKLKSKYPPEKISIRELQKFLAGLKGTANFSFTGGEPLLVKNIIKVFAEITKKHYFGLLTNLISESVKELAEKIKPERVSYIIASAHIPELERLNLYDRFFENYDLLNKRGFNITVEDIAYPQIAAKAEDYRKLFREHGIELKFHPFFGMQDEKNYPYSYTYEELKDFDFLSYLEKKEDIYCQKGNLCIAGYNTAVINRDGEIYPCFQISESIGNIGEGIKLSETLIKCPFESCGFPFNVHYPQLMKKALNHK